LCHRTTLRLKSYIWLQWHLCMWTSEFILPDTLLLLLLITTSTGCV